VFAEASAACAAGAAGAVGAVGEGVSAGVALTGDPELIAVLASADTGMNVPAAIIPGRKTPSSAGTGWITLGTLDK
jgi:hypothetical protein